MDWTQTYSPALSSVCATADLSREPRCTSVTPTTGLHKSRMHARIKQESCICCIEQESCILVLAPIRLMPGRIPRPPPRIVRVRMQVSRGLLEGACFTLTLAKCNSIRHTGPHLHRCYELVLVVDACARCLCSMFVLDATTGASPCCFVPDVFCFRARATHG